MEGLGGQFILYPYISYTSRLTLYVSRFTVSKELWYLREIFKEEGREAAEVMHAHDAKIFSGFTEDIGDEVVVCSADAQTMPSGSSC